MVRSQPAFLASGRLTMGTAFSTCMAAQPNSSCSCQLELQSGQERIATNSWSDGLTMTVRTLLPLGPLLRNYCHGGLRASAEMGPRYDAISRAKAAFFNPEFLQG